MKKSLLTLTIGLLLSTSSLFAQDCFTRLQQAFNERGSFPISDDMHRNVYLSFFEDGSTMCILGKCRVVDGLIESVFLQYEDDTYQLMESKFYNNKKQPPTIDNGISEMILTEDGKKFRVIFIDQLRPKQKSFKQVDLQMICKPIEIISQPVGFC